MRFGDVMEAMVSQYLKLDIDAKLVALKNTLEVLQQFKLNL